MSAGGNAGTVVLLGVGAGALYLAMTQGTQLAAIWKRVSAASSITGPAGAIDSAVGISPSVSTGVNNVLQAPNRAAVGIHNWIGCSIFGVCDPTPATTPTPKCGPGLTYDPTSGMCFNPATQGQPESPAIGGPDASYYIPSMTGGITRSWTGAFQA